MQRKGENFYHRCKSSTLLPLWSAYLTLQTIHSVLLNLAPGRVEGRGRSVPPDPGFPAVAARQEAGGGKALTAGPPLLEPQPRSTELCERPSRVGVNESTDKQRNGEEAGFCKRRKVSTYVPQHVPRCLDSNSDSTW